jgi:flagellar P-ring protein FlgI
MRFVRVAMLAAVLASTALDAPGAASRIKDLASVEGVRQNQLIGYGLVVGLNGTGRGSSTRMIVTSRFVPVPSV